MTWFHTRTLRWSAAATVCAFVLVAVTAVTLAQGQGTSRLHGTVTDQTGGVVPGAVVTVAIGSGNTPVSYTHLTLPTNREV